MQLFAARELCISLIFLIYLSTSFGQTNSILIDKIRQLNTGTNNTHLLSNIRLKRQYFKPPIDGPWFANPGDRSLNLASKTSRRESGPYDIKVVESGNKTLRTRNDDTKVTPNRSEVTVASLSISLINLFDRIKETLCNLINSNC